jgi:hypothetical protein
VSLFPHVSTLVSGSVSYTHKIKHLLDSMMKGHYFVSIFLEFHQCIQCPLYLSYFLVISRDLIRAVRACKTAAEEREVIAKECASIRTAIKDEENPYRHRNVAKLLFVHMLGYPTHFGQMECLKLIASHKFPEKRIGYLGLMLLLDEETEVLMLVTNSLKNDLNHANQFIVGQALCALGDIGSPDMCRDLASEVEKLLSSNNQYIRKKACLALLRIVRKCPDFLEHYLERIPTLLSDRSHGVLVGTLALMIEISEASPAVVVHMRRHTQQLVRMLKNLVLSGYAPEHDVSGLTDPFLQALPALMPSPRRMPSLAAARARIRAGYRRLRPLGIWGSCRRHLRRLSPPPPPLSSPAAVLSCRCPLLPAPVLSGGSARPPAPPVSQPGLAGRSYPRLGCAGAGAGAGAGLSGRGEDGEAVVPVGGSPLSPYRRAE